MVGLLSCSKRRFGPRRAIRFATIFLSVALLGGVATVAHADDAAFERYRDRYGLQHWGRGLDGPVTTLASLSATLRVDKLHKKGFDGTGIGVALIDTGVSPVPGLQADRIVDGPDLSFDSQVPGALHIDGNGHGTHMAGIIASDLPGNRGMAPDATLVSVKVGAHDGAVDVSQVIAAINWVVEHRDDAGLNIKVLAIAYGTDSTQDPMVDPLSYAVESAWNNGITVVVAGGNDGHGARLISTATNPYVIAVGASDANGTRRRNDDVLAEFTSDGTERRIDVLAPGVSVASLRSPGSFVDSAYPEAIIDDSLIRGSGTSQATAAVAGAIASLLEAHPTLRPDEVKALLRSTARPVRRLDKTYVSGVADVAKASDRYEEVGEAQEARTPAQTWTPATGLGSIDESRGTARLELEGVELSGEIDIFGNPWDGRSWTDATWAGRSWTGGDWLGRSWTGAEWTGRSWTGAEWTGRSWTGRSWTGRSWTGRSWTEYDWASDDWLGRSWTGRSWTGRSWTLDRWSATDWTGRSWTWV